MKSGPRIETRNFCFIALGLIASLIFCAGSFAQSTKKDKSADNPQDQVTALRVVVTGGPQNKPIDNASVYLRWNEHRFLRHDKQIEFDLKTDMKGVATVKDVPRMRIMIQVVKKYWKPFGRYYTLDKPEQTIAIQLQPPPHWY